MRFGHAMLAEFPLDPAVTYLNHGTVGVTPKVGGFQSQLVGNSLTLNFSRRALMDAGVLTPSSTELDLTGSLTTGVQITGAVSVVVH